MTQSSGENEVARGPETGGVGTAAAAHPQLGVEALNHASRSRLQRRAGEPAAAYLDGRSGPPRFHERVLSEALDSLGGLIALLDPDGRVIYFNAGCERASGWSAREAYGRVFWECPFLPADERASISQTLRTAKCGS